MKTILKGAVWVFVATIGAVVGFVFNQYWIQAPTVATENPDVPAPGVHALGSIQPQDGVIEVAVPQGFRPSRFHKKAVLKEWVAKDQELAYLDGYDEREREIAVINSEITAAGEALGLENENEQAALADIEFERANALQLGKLQIEALDWKIAGLAKRKASARKQFENVMGLERNNTIPDQQFEQLRVQSEVSLDEWEYANAERKRADQEIKLTTSKEAIDRRRTKVQLAAKRARAQYALATLLRKKELAVEAQKRCKVVAPATGRILEITTHEGEAAAGKPLLKLGNTEHLFVLAEVYEDERKDVKVGQTAEIKGRGLPLDPDKSLIGKVERIHPMVGGHKQSPLDPSYRDNSRVYEVWIRLREETTDERKVLQSIREYILQPVDVTIQTGSGHSPGKAAEGRP